MSTVTSQMRDASSLRMINAAFGEFARKGYSGARIADIAEEAGVSKGLLSQRFGSKEELFCAVIRKKLEKFQPSGSPLNVHASGLKGIVAFIKKEAQRKTELFAFLSVLTNEAELPASAMNCLEQWFHAAGLEETMRRETGNLSGNPFRRFYSWMRVVLGIMSVFSNAGMEPPPAEDYLPFIGASGDSGPLGALQLPGSSAEDVRKYRTEAMHALLELADDYEGVLYVTLTDQPVKDEYRVYRKDSVILKKLPGWVERTNFHDRLDLMRDLLVHPDDREEFYRKTRRDVILSNIAVAKAYYVDFRSLTDGKISQLQMKFAADRDETGEIRGFAAGLRDTGKDKARAIEEHKSADIINVLSYEYTAVYYVDELNGSYDILYQQGHVKESVNEMLSRFPSYTDAFLGYVEMLVHPDDKKMMRREVQLIPEHLRTNKSFKVEFRRNYGGKYLYTEMKCVKVGEAEDPLTAFVVGFAENDREYRSHSEQQRQLEQAVLERSSELQEKNRALNRINEEIVELLGNITEARDMSSGLHVRRIKGLTRIIARQVMHDWPEYGLTPDNVELITSASALHDLGKIMIPDAILLKPDRLTPDEFEVMKEHCEKGCEMLERAPSDWSDTYKKISYDIIRYHHEKVDGSGYPLGLKGEEIPISAQIVSIADCLDALTSERIYKKAFDKDTAYRMILDGECGAFSEKLLSSFTACRAELFRQIDGAADTVVSFLPAGLVRESLSWTKILLVDDNAASRALGAEILESEGAMVIQAADGREALRLFAECEPGTIDAILLDTEMPGIDGLTAALTIREMERSDAKTVPIMGIASIFTEQEMNRCFSSGMDSVLTKPISIATFNRVLYECLGRQSSALGDAVKLAEDTASAHLEKALSLLSGGSNSRYELLCYINGNTNDVSAWRVSPVFERLLKGISARLPSNRRLDQLLRMIIPEKDLPAFLEDVNRVKIIRFLETHESYLLFLQAIIEGRSVLLRLRLMPDKSAPGCFILGLQNMDKENLEGQRSRELLSTLMESYVVVDYIDFEKDTYKRYSRREGNNDDPSFGGTFSELAASYVYKYVDERDKDRMSVQLTVPTLRAQLSTRKRLSFRYRSIRSGEPRYYEMQFVNIGDDAQNRYALLTLSDIDDLVKKEAQSSRILQETQRQLVEAEAKASRDPLTGVKDITAYTETVSALSARAIADEKLEFAIVMCDANYMTHINNAFGFETGNAYIRSCCKMVCDVFVHSPVYRIGGDEFVALLTGQDYARRKELCDKLRSDILLSEQLPLTEAGRVSMSVGVAEYDAVHGDTVADVIRRANTEMNRNKLNYSSGPDFWPQK